MRLEKTFVGVINFESEEGGRALVDHYSDMEETGPEGIGVRVSSWDNDMKHPEFSLFQDKKVKITLVMELVD